MGVLQLRPQLVPALRLHLARRKLYLRCVRQLSDPGLADLRLAATKPPTLWFDFGPGRALRRLVQPATDRLGPQRAIPLRHHHRQPDPHHADADDLFQAALQRHPVGSPLRQIRAHYAAVAAQQPDRRDRLAAGHLREDGQHQLARQPVGGAGRRLRQGRWDLSQRTPRADSNRDIQRQYPQGQPHWCPELDQRQFYRSSH